ncbi:thioredoxin family protein [Bacteroidetes/Chlorobi group bacterium MS-B_bin-24]|jgi:small redox-active disulfide protein 2|nr:MAG: thioredoxin family protein [Bacteroidetes/Chlorobi group bacterium MS-B_bin-24]
MAKVKIKVLGPGCPKCQALERRVREVVEKNNFDAEVIKVENLMDIMKYGVMITPALVINEKLYASGTPLPSTDKLTDWIKQHLD